MASANLLHDLAQFTGTETWHRHWLQRNLLYTDGVRFFEQNAGGGAGWFIDIVATEIFGLLAKEGFLCISIKVVGNTPSITVDDGNDNILFERSNIEYTDCPEGIWKFYLTDNVLLLPSEY